MKLLVATKSFITTVSCAVLLGTPFIQQALAINCPSGYVCEGDKRIDPVKDAKCACSDINGCDPLKSITGHGGYDTVVDACSGSMGITSEPEFDYYDTKLCNLNTQYGNLAKCLATLVLAGLSTPAIVAACTVDFTRVGCAAEIGTAGVAVASECEYCAWNTCTDDDSDTIPNNEFPEKGNGTQCPPPPS